MSFLKTGQAAQPPSSAPSSTLSRIASRQVVLDPATCPLDELPIKLPPLPYTHHRTREEFDANAEEQREMDREARKNVDGDDMDGASYETALDRERLRVANKRWQQENDKERAFCDAPSVRMEVVYPWDGADALQCLNEDTDNERWRTRCLVCEAASVSPEAGALVMARIEWYKPQRVRARCLRGCSPAKIADAIARRIIAHEARERQRAETERVDAVLDESCAVHADAHVPHPCIIEGTIPEAALVILYGDTSSRKTFAAQMLAVSVATKTPWLDRNVNRSGRVAGVYLEGSEALRDRRFARIAKGYGTSLDELQRQRLLPSYRQPLTTTDEQSLAAYVEWLRVVQPIMSIVDSASRLGALNWSDPGNVTRHLEPLARISQGKFAPGLPPIPHVLIAHANERGTIRGGQAALQDADLVWEVDAKNNEYTSPIQFRPGKDRYSIDPCAFDMRLVDGDDKSIRAELYVKNSKAQTPDEPTNDPRHVRIAELLNRSPGQSLNKIRDGAGVSQRDVGRLVRDMEARGLVELREGLWYPVTE